MLRSLDDIKTKTAIDAYAVGKLSEEMDMHSTVCVWSTFKPCNSWKLEND